MEITLRDIQLNLNFTWESENININPCGWVLKSSKINGKDCTSTSSVNLIFYKDVNSSKSYTFNIPTFFSTVFKSTELNDDELHSFSLKYIPEKFKGVYSQYKDAYSLDAYKQLNIGKITDTSSEQKEIKIFEENLLNNLIEKQFQYKPYFNQDSLKYSNTKYQFTYSDFTTYRESVKLLIDKTKITDQLMVQLLNASIIKNVDLQNIPLREQEINGETYTCSSGIVWEYEIVPVMPYGLLQALAIKGSIDLMDIGIYKQKINSFKYYNSGFQSTLKMDMTSFNSEGKTLDLVKLVFHDIYGEVCSYTLPKMISYNGTFQVTVPLDGSLHSGMQACATYPNLFSTDPLSYSPEKGIVALPNKNFVRNTEKLIESLDKKSVTEENEKLLRAYHSTQEPEGLHKDYLYWVTVELKLEEEIEFTKTDYGFWYWTNSKFNEYYFRDDILSYNDIPFDLDLSVKVGITGNSPDVKQTEESGETSGSYIYTENNSNNPFTIKIYPDFNNYNTLFVDSNNTASFLKEIKYGINKDRQEWNRDLATIQVSDDTLDNQSYVNWTIDPTPFTPTDDTLSYYPSFGNTNEQLTFNSKLINNLTNVKLDNLKLYLYEDIKRVYQYNFIKQNKKIKYYSTIKKEWKEKFIYPAMYSIPNPKPRTLVWVKDSLEEMISLENSMKNEPHQHIDQLSPTYYSDGEAKSSLYINSYGQSSIFGGAWFASSGGVALNTSKFGLDDNQIGYIWFFGWIGTHMYTKLDGDWQYQGAQKAEWETSAGHYVGKEEPKHGTTGANEIDKFLYYKYNGNVYIYYNFSGKHPCFGKTLYCIDKTNISEGTFSVNSEIQQNSGYIQNLQDLVVQIEGKENPTIYLGHLNINLWKKIENSDSNAKCISFKFNNIAQAVQTLQIKLKYPQKYLDEVDYFYDEVSGVQILGDYTVYYKDETGKIVYLHDVEYGNKGLKINYLLNTSAFPNWDCGVYCAYFVEAKYDSGKEVNKKGHIKDWTGNAMAGTLAVPYRILT